MPATLSPLDLLNPRIAHEVARVIARSPRAAFARDVLEAAIAARQALVARFRIEAQDRGILWLRPILEANKVDKPSELSDDAMNAALTPEALAAADDAEAALEPAV